MIPVAVAAKRLGVSYQSIVMDIKKGVRKGEDRHVLKIIIIKSGKTKGKLVALWTKRWFVKI